MAKITPIDVVKGISGKLGKGSSNYFATNKSSNKIHYAKYTNKPTGTPTQEQQDQMAKFGLQAKNANAWLRANRPSEQNGPKGTDAYQEALSLKKQMQLSNVRQIVIKYMDNSGRVTLPSSYVNPAQSGSDATATGTTGNETSNSNSEGTDTNGDGDDSGDSDSDTGTQGSDASSATSTSGGGLDPSGSDNHTTGSDNPPSQSDTGSQGSDTTPSGSDTGSQGDGGGETTPGMVTLSISSANPEQGTVNTSVNRQYPAGAKISIKATPADGYTFSHWSDGNTNATRILTLNTSQTLVAHFV